MGSVDAMEVGEVQDFEPIPTPNLATQVFAIPGLMSQILSQCHFLSSTADLLQLRLVSNDFNEAVLDLKVTLGNLRTPRLSIYKMTTSESNSSSTSFDELLLSSIDARMCRTLVAKFTSHCSVVDHTIRHNLVGVIRAHGKTIQELHLCVPEDALFSVMRAVDIQCPNLQNLDLWIVVECSDHGPRHQGVVPIDDRFGPFTPHFALTKMSLHRIWKADYDAEESKVCNRTTDVLAAIVAGAPNLDSLNVGGDALLRLDLARNHKLQTLRLEPLRLKPFSLELREVHRHQMQEIWDMVASRSDTLEKLTFDFGLVELPDEPYPPSSDDVPTIGANPPTFQKLKKLKFVSDYNMTDGLSSAFERTILGGRAPLLEDLRMELDGKDCWENVLSAVDRHRRPLEFCRVLELSKIIYLSDAIPLLGQLRDSFPNVTRLALTAGQDEKWGVHLDLDPELEEAFRRLLRWTQLKELTWTMEGTLSIRQLAQLLALLGQGFFMTRGLRSFELRTNRWEEPRGGNEMRELERIFGLNELEEFLPSLLWMRAMEMMTRGGGIRERLLEFVQENQLPIMFSDEGG